MTNVTILNSILFFFPNDLFVILKQLAGFVFLATRRLVILSTLLSRLSSLLTRRLIVAVQCWSHHSLWKVLGTGDVSLRLIILIGGPLSLDAASWLRGPLVPILRLRIIQISSLMLLLLLKLYHIIVLLWLLLWIFKRIQNIHTHVSVVLGGLRMVVARIDRIA